MVLFVAEEPLKANYGVWAKGEGSIAMWHATTVTTHMVWPLGQEPTMWNEPAWHCGR